MLCPQHCDSSVSPAVGPGACGLFVCCSWFQAVSLASLVPFLTITSTVCLELLFGSWASAPPVFLTFLLFFLIPLGIFSCIFLLLSLSPCVFVCVWVRVDACASVCDFSVSQSLPLHLDVLFAPTPSEHLLLLLQCCCLNCSLSW